MASLSGMFVQSFGGGDAEEIPEYATVPILDSDPHAWTPNKKNGWSDKKGVVLWQGFAYLPNTTVLEVFESLTKDGVARLFSDGVEFHYPVWDREDHPRTFTRRVERDAEGNQGKVGGGRTRGQIMEVSPNKCVSVGIPSITSKLRIDLLVILGIRGRGRTRTERGYTNNPAGGDSPLSNPPCKRDGPRGPTPDSGAGHGGNGGRSSMKRRVETVSGEIFGQEVL